MRWAFSGAAALAVACAAVGMLAGCSQAPPPGAMAEGLQAARFAAIPGWTDDRLGQTLPALLAECRRLSRLPAETALGGAGLAAQFGGRAGQWAHACSAARTLAADDDAAARRYYEAWFAPYRVSETALITGYYEPEVKGSWTRGGAFQTPLLARPADLVQRPAAVPNAPPAIGRLQQGRLVPYWSRREIEDGMAGGAARPLFYLGDPADLFFLQVQGSGRIRLPDGSVVRVGYDGKNGRAYTPIGRVLADAGEMGLGDVTMQSIRAWLAAHPAQARAVMDRNEDYVFFRILADADAGLGPPGALGVKLSAGRSVAVDRQAVPLGAPLFLDTTEPLTNAPWRRLVLAQDLGTDIVGPARTDIFLGWGDLAAQQAGRMRQAGVEYLLLPRPAS